MKTKETKKRNSTVKSIISTALAALLCMTMSLPVFAQPIFPTSPIDDNYSRGNTAAITKHLDTPVGTELPTGAKALTFYFQIEKIGFNNVRFSSSPTAEEQATITDMPHLIGTTVINSTKSEIPITFDGDDYIYNSPDDISSGTKSIFKETNDLFNGIEWKKPGVYTYEIREIEDKTKDALQTVASNDGYTESMTFSKAVYLLSVWVEDGPDGLHITAIGDIKDIDDNGDKTDGSKVDPTPGGGTDTEKPYSKMIFRNIYTKNNGGGPDITNPNNTTLKISKEVKDGGSRTQYFTFDVTVTQPVLVSGTQKYKAYVMEADGTGSKVVTTIENYATIDANGLIEFTSGIPMSIKLKHGQWLAFTDLYVGSEFTVKELATPDYSPSCTLTAYSSKNPQLSIYTETITKGEGASLTAPPDEPTATFGKAYVADNNKSIAEFINTFKLIAPTGIGVDDLPYIVIIGVVLAVAAGYVVFRIRRTPKEQA